MTLIKQKKKKMRIRNKLKKFNKNSRYRLTVNRSSKNIYAQIIDDLNNNTLVAASSIEKEIKKNNKGNKSDLSKHVGEALAKRANVKKITKVYFDRGSYKYHGRIKLLSDVLRKNGLDF